MRFSGFSASAFLLALALISILPFQAEARSKDSLWRWGASNWQEWDFQPYIGEEQIRQRSLWDKDTWTPEAWINDAGDEKRIMRDLYASSIITGQYTDRDNIPVLEVGENFVQLSGVDQRRVLQFVDYIFQITTSEENGMFYVMLEEDKSEPLGLYNQHGFQSY